MAREFMDGFETGDLSLWDSASGWISLESTAGTMLQGAKCLNLSSNGSIVKKNITARDHYYIALKIRPQSGSSPFLLFQNGSITLGSLGLASNCLVAYRGWASTLLATSAPLVSFSVVHLVEVYYLPKTDLTGVFTVKLNGITVIDVSGKTADDGLPINVVALCTSASSANISFDDVIIDSSNWIGNTNIQAAFPTGAGSTTQYTPTAGANYTCVDEVPASDTDYVYTNTAGLVDTYAMGDLTGTGVVKSVQVVARANYSGAATPISLKGVLRSGGTNYDSTGAAALSYAMTGYGFIWETDPATSAAWTVSGVNAVEAGIKSV